MIMMTLSLDDLPLEYPFSLVPPAPWHVALQVKNLTEEELKRLEAILYLSGQEVDRQKLKEYLPNISDKDLEKLARALEKMYEIRKNKYECNEPMDIKLFYEKNILFGLDMRCKSGKFVIPASLMEMILENIKNS